MVITDQVQQFLNQDYLDMMNIDNDSYNIKSDDDHNIHAVLARMNDLKTINTFGYEIRRYLAKNCPKFFGKCSIPVDANEWSNEVVEIVVENIANHIHEIEGKKVTDLRKTWRKYLNNIATPERDSVIRTAFYFNMSYEDTLKLLLASGQEPFELRNPLELIEYFCKKNNRLYQFNDVMDLVNQYLEGIKNTSTKKFNLKTKPYTYENQMTSLITGKVNELINDETSHLSRQEQEEQLIQFMIEHADSFTLKTKNKNKITFEHGYSLTRRALYFELTQYLVKMYPTYQAVEDDIVKNNEELDKEDNGKWNLMMAIFDNNEVEVGYDSKKNLPDLKNLVRAMIDKNKLEIGDEHPNTPFAESVMKFLKDYYDRITRIYNGEPVTRKDVLILVYFFVAGYMLSDDQDELKEQLKEQLKEVEEKNKELAKLVDDQEELKEVERKKVELALLVGTIDLIDSIFDEEMDDGNPEYIYNWVKNIINGFLTTFNYSEFPLYLPLPFDRFVTLSILSHYTMKEEFAPLLTYLQYGSDEDEDIKKFVEDI